MSRQRAKLKRSPSRERRRAQRAAVRSASLRSGPQDREDQSGWVVCDRCGLHQLYRTASAAEELAPCAGPLGLPCTGETCITVDHYREEVET